MKFAALLLLVLSAQAFAADSVLVYTEGAYKGKDVLKNPAHFAYDAFCFKGNAMSARQVIYKHLTADIYEKENVFARYVQKDNAIVFGYLDTKCTDEGSEPAECRTTVIVKACK